MENNIEIELKFPLLNPEEVEIYLTDNARIANEATQHDIYFDPPHKSFVSNLDNVCEWFRVRVVGMEAQINYKDWLPHDTKLKTHCTEYETNVSSKDQIFHILKALGFRKLVEVNKLRKSWVIDDIEISIDTVAGLGSYIELEYKGKVGTIDDARNYLEQTVGKIGAITEEIDVKGYPFLLLDKSQK